MPNIHFLPVNMPTVGVKVKCTQFQRIDPFWGIMANASPDLLEDLLKFVFVWVSYMFVFRECPMLGVCF
jgi:hypothetical protein